MLVGADGCAWPALGCSEPNRRVTIAEGNSGGSYEQKHDQHLSTFRDVPDQYGENGVSTNSIESVWAVLKRGVYGVYHQVSKKHLHR